MDISSHSLESLFDQLGLKSTPESVEQFIKANGRLSPHIELHEASCWSQQQASCIKAMKENDGDWAMVVDELNVRMR